MRDITLGETIYIPFTTRAFATGIPTTLAGTPVVSAYVDAGLTQITAGITLGVDHDGVTGANMLTIVATSGNGFADSTDVGLMITTGTVGGVSVVGEIVGEFTIGRSAANVTKWLGTAVATPTVAGVPEVDLTHMEGVTQSVTDLKDFADAGYDPATNKVQGVVLVDTTTTNTDMRGTDSAGTAAELAKVPKSDSTVTWNATALGSINAECDTALTDYDGPTNAEMEARTLVAASYFDPAADTVSNVTLVATTTTNTDMVTEPPTAVQNRQEMDSNSTQLAAIVLDTGTTLPALIDDLAVKKNATFSNFEFLMVLTSDHVTPATGLTVTGQRSIDGGAFAGVTGAIAEVSNGIYQFDAVAGDTNGDFITWRFSSATADDAFVSFKTVA
jgi:hypothetical protein